MESAVGGDAGGNVGATFGVIVGAVVSDGAEEGGGGSGSDDLEKSFLNMLSMSREASLACSSDFVDNNCRALKSVPRA